MISRARLKYLKSLGRKKVRREENKLLVEGLHVVEEAVARGCVEELYLAEDLSAPEWLEGGIDVQRLSAAEVMALDIDTYAELDWPPRLRPTLDPEMLAGKMGAGFEVVSAGDVIDGKADLDQMGRCVVTIDGSELARGGGGCRCMTMPIGREPVTG